MFSEKLFDLSAQHIVAIAGGSDEAVTRFPIQIQGVAEDPFELIPMQCLQESPPTPVPWFRCSGKSVPAPVIALPHLPAEPSPREVPLAIQSCGGEPGDGRHLFGPQTGEEAHLDDLYQLGVLFLQGLESVFQGDEIGALRISLEAFEGCLWKPLPPAAPFLVPLAPGVIDQDATHDAPGDREEMGSVLPLDPVLVDEAQEGLIDESRCLERVTVSFLP